jgi:antitoxin CcdA
MATTDQHIYENRRRIDVSIDSGLLTEAKNLNVDISRAAEQGLKQALTERREALWIEENRAALESSNTYVDRHGLPLAKHRGF